MYADRADYLGPAGVKVQWPIFSQARWEEENLGGSTARKMQLLQPLLDKHVHGSQDLFGALYCLLYAVLPEMGIMSLETDPHGALDAKHTLQFDAPLKGTIASVQKGGFKKAVGANVLLSEQVMIKIVSDETLVGEHCGDIEVELKGVKASKSIGVKVKTIKATTDGHFIFNGMPKHPMKFAKILRTAADITWSVVARASTVPLVCVALTGCPFFLRACVCCVIGLS